MLSAKKCQFFKFKFDQMSLEIMLSDFEEIKATSFLL